MRKNFKGQMLRMDNYNITALRAASHFVSWIKEIPINKTVPLGEYEFATQFTKVANVVLDNELNERGERRRKTVIRFAPTIPIADFKRKAEWIYIFTIDGQIVKIGGTRTGLQGRCGSYLCGHHITERGGSRDCSKTNGYIYNTFEFYLQHGCAIEMYGFLVPRAEIQVNVFGRAINDVAQVYHIYESVALSEFKRKFGFNPFLSDNSDPTYQDP